RGNYAIICIEIDITKPLKSKYRLWRRVQRVEYQGLHVVCFKCGRYGHGVGECSLPDLVSGEGQDSTPNQV
ncbi:hypothetical protein LINPERHAP1_LOCUS13195, partial [Linum perenne]